MLIGGQAVLIHGEPRMTRDVDVVLAADPWNCQPIIDVFERVGARPAVENPVDFVKETLLLPFDDLRTGVRVDVAFTNSEYEQTAIARAELIRFSSENVPVATPEDLIIHKILALRPQDVIDVKGILIRKPSIDVDEIRKWLRQFESVVEKPLVSEFDRILAQVWPTRA